MRFKTDENLPIERAELLRQSQPDARSVAREVEIEWKSGHS
jgi:hypothetical protein